MLRLLAESIVSYLSVPLRLRDSSTAVVSTVWLESDFMAGTNRNAVNRPHRRRRAFFVPEANVFLLWKFEVRNSEPYSVSRLEMVNTEADLATCGPPFSPRSSELGGAAF